VERGGPPLGAHNRTLAPLPCRRNDKAVQCYHVGPVRPGGGGATKTDLWVASAWITAWGDTRRIGGLCSTGAVLLRDAMPCILARACSTRSLRMASPFTSLTAGMCRVLTGETPITKHTCPTSSPIPSP
jgi:hypothetical protein